MEMEEAGRKREPPCQMEVAEVGRKREPPGQMATEEAERQRTARMVIKEEAEFEAWMKERRKHTKKLIEESLLSSAAARLKAEDPGAEPIVLEALTEQQRAALAREEGARIKRSVKEYAKQQMAELKEEMARARSAPPVETDPDEDWSERLYSTFRESWILAWADEFGSFDDTTRIPPMYFTDKPMPSCTFPEAALQIFSVKVAGISKGLWWPLNVFGMMSVRDTLDHNRNIIFNRTRDNCQTLTEKDPYLLLTGPSRAPVYGYGPVHFDTVLKVKGSTESEDKDLSLLAGRYYTLESLNQSFVTTEAYTSKHNTLEVTFGMVAFSIEATIAVRVIADGSWPDGFRGRFTARTASMDQLEFLLLDSRNEKVRVAADGTVELSRRVVSVERSGKLTVSVTARRGGGGGGDEEVVTGAVTFVPMDAGRSYREFDVGLCKMEVSVAWSLPPSYCPLSPINGTGGEAGASN